MRHYSFRRLVGNPVTIGLIKRSLANDTFKNFSIFGGTLGVGKSTCAGIAAMALTCESPVNGEPCMHCTSCKLNKHALESAGSSPSLRVVNLGTTEKFGDIGELIKDVFCLQGSGARQVYIFEEAHALAKIRGGFTAFLAEIDRMPPNVYIIMCTTAMNEIPNDLKSRALLFNFNRLNRKESFVLLDSILKEKSVQLPEEVSSLIIKHSKGIPRDIEKLINFTVENNVSKEEMRSYLQEVSMDSLIELFNTMREPSFASMLEFLESILSDTTIKVFIDTLKDFLINVLFYMECGDKKDFTNDEILELDRLFNIEILGKCVPIVEKLRKEATESDIKLAMIKMRTIFQNRPDTSIVTDKAKVAAQEKLEAAKGFQEIASVKPTASRFTTLSTQMLDQFK